MKPRTPLKRSTPPRRTPLKRTTLYPAPQWVKNFWEWVRAQPCVICGRLADGLLNLGIVPEYAQLSLTEVAHVGARGLGQKSDPREVLPLCGVLHHRLGPYSHHRLGKRFWEFHGLNKETIVREYQERYLMEHPEAAFFFGLIGHESASGIDSVRPGGEL